LEAKPDAEEAIPPKEPATLEAKPGAVLPIEDVHTKPIVTDADQSVAQPAPPKSADEEVILVCPLLDGEAIEDAAKGLFLGEDPHTCSAAHLLQLQQEKTTPQRHFSIITNGDYSRVKPGVYFHDVLVDFCLQWITRKESVKESLIFVFNTHFYTKSVTEGVSAVCSCTNSRGIDIFSKKMLLIPIHKTLHWSLCVVFHPGSVTQFTDSDEIICMYH
jgi:hypothetical protein